MAFYGTTPKKTRRQLITELYEGPTLKPGPIRTDWGPNWTHLLFSTLITGSSGVCRLGNVYVVYSDRINKVLLCRRIINNSLRIREWNNNSVLSTTSSVCCYKRWLVKWGDRTSTKNTTSLSIGQQYRFHSQPATVSCRWNIRKSHH